jgi:hypothetical protein
MSHDSTLLGGIDPEITRRLLNRRDAIRRGVATSSTVAAGLAMGSAPVALAVLARDAFGQSSALPADVTSVLDFALMLEIFENEFYKAVLGTSANATVRNAFASVRSGLTTSEMHALQQIQKHEQQHVTFLLANGATNTLDLEVTSTSSSFDFTGNRSASGGGPFALAGTNLNVFLATAQIMEDTGVAAYKGQAPTLMHDTTGTTLEAALRIHAVEARHASKIRRMRRMRGAPDTVRFAGYIQGSGTAAAGISNLDDLDLADAVTSAFNAVYTHEGNTNQANVNVANLTNTPSDITMSTAATMAFDEPLSRAEVIAIVQPFFVATLPST